MSVPAFAEAHNSKSLQRLIDQQMPSWAGQINSVAKALFRSPVGFGTRDRPKVVHDAVIGAIKGDAWLFDLLDTYVVQRLRQIRQLSLANLTYPSAEHSRFAHTIGVLARVQGLADRLDLDAQVRQNAVAAAILHDIGHGPFSHLSEDAYRFQDWFDGVVGTNSSVFGVAAKPHEVLGALLITSEAAREFFVAFNKANKTDLQPLLIAKFIVGLPPADKAAVGQIVNGWVDGDKLDYLLRDAYMSGLGIGVDADRWILAHRKLKNLSQLSLDPVLSRRLPEQIAFGKWTLRSALYNHKTVRAADVSYMSWAVAMAQDASATLGDLTIRSPVDFLRMTDADVMGTLTKARGVDKTSGGESDVVEVLRQRLRERYLPVEVKKYSKQDLKDRGLRRIFGAADDRSTRSAMLRAIHKVCSGVADDVGAETKYDVWLDVPETWTKDPASELTDGDEAQEDAPVADVADRVGEIFDDEKYRARLFAVRPISAAVLARTDEIFANLEDELRLSRA